MPDWDELWLNAGLDEADRAAWREALSYRTKRPEDAVTLARHGWKPADIVAARVDPAVYWPGLRSATVPVERTEGMTAALMLLADETAKFHEHRSNLAREVRAQHISDLAERLPEGKGWSHERIGSLLGLTRQRVRMILKRKAL